MRDEEGEEKSENERSDYVQMSLGKKSENDLEKVVIYIKEIKEKKERQVLTFFLPKAYLEFLATILP